MVWIQKKDIAEGWTLDKSLNLEREEMTHIFLS